MEIRTLEVFTDARPTSCVRLKEFNCINLVYFAFHGSDCICFIFYMLLFVLLKYSNKF